MPPRVGSLLNHLAGQSIQSYAEPKVGDGVTICHWTDREAATVVGIESPGTILVQADKVKYNYPSGSPKSIERDPNGSVLIVKRVRRGREKGQWRVNGMVVMVGVKDPHYDYQF